MMITYVRRNEHKMKRNTEIGLFTKPSNMIVRPMKYLPYKNLNYRFDFEIGYLTKSPCRECEERKDFPDCINDCKKLDKIHNILCEAISCSKRL
jgi:hypothetical protein